MKEVKSWLRQEGESEINYRYFQTYLRLSDRSLSAVAEHHDKSINTIQNVSSQYNWKDRALAWDQQQMMNYADSVDAQEAMKRSHQMLYSNLEELMSKALSDWQKHGNSKQLETLLKNFPIFKDPNFGKEDTTGDVTEQLKDMFGEEVALQFEEKEEQK